MASKIVEIRWHGRGGQGAVASAEMLALAVIDTGRAAQAFPSFGPERRGAPVIAFNRVADEFIRLRTGVHFPDIIVVLDPTVMGAVDVTAGLKDEGILVVNTSIGKEALAAKYNLRHKLFTVDAKKIAVEEIGYPITNTTMMGALARATGLIALEPLENQIRIRFPAQAEKNIRALRRAYDETE